MKRVFPARISPVVSLGLVLVGLLSAASVSGSVPRCSSPSAFLTQPAPPNRQPWHAERPAGWTSGGVSRRWASSFASSAVAKPTLDQRTAWRLDLSLKKNGSSSEPIELSLRVRFIEKKNYEPPQGQIFIERDGAGLVRQDERGFAAEGGSWMLSEDKKDRKWGIWVWGLFEEPLYPYLYLTLPVYDDVELDDDDSSSSDSGSSEPKMTMLYDGLGVPGGRLELRFDHAREEGAVRLSKGRVWYRPVEMMKADPLGLGGMVNVGEEVEAGLASLWPLQ